MPGGEAGVVVGSKGEPSSLALLRPVVHQVVAVGEDPLQEAEVVGGLAPPAGPATDEHPHLADGAEPLMGFRRSWRLGPQNFKNLWRLVAGRFRERSCGVEDGLLHVGARKGLIGRIARGLLHLCDVHLERARFHLAAGEDGEARRCLDAARVLVEECGYHRRDGEVEFLEERLRMLDSSSKARRWRQRPRHL